MLRLDVRPRSQALRCTYCFDSLPNEGVHACAGCGTILHGECAAELTACPTIGCERELGVRAFDLRSLSDALDFAEGALQAALEEGDFRARRQAQESYNAARLAYRKRDRERFKLGHSPTQHREPPKTLRAAPAPKRASIWALPPGWWFYLWATALPSIMSTNYLLQQLPFRIGIVTLFASAFGLSIGSLYGLKGLYALGSWAWKRGSQVNPRPSPERSN